MDLPFNVIREIMQFINMDLKVYQKRKIERIVPIVKEKKKEEYIYWHGSFSFLGNIRLTDDLLSPFDGLFIKNSDDSDKVRMSDTIEEYVVNY